MFISTTWPRSLGAPLLLIILNILTAQTYFLTSSNEDTSFQFQFSSVKDDTSFRIRNKTGDIQQAHIIDDDTSKLLIQADLHTVVHGKNSNSPITFIIIIFRLIGASSERRFRPVQISIHFQDEKQRSTQDPGVVGLWPQGVFTLNTTEGSREETTGTSASATPEFAGITGGSVAWTRECNSTHQTTDQAYLVGAIRIEGRNYGKMNAIRMKLFERSSQKTGAITELQTAILLNRGNDDRFLAHIVVDATADFTYAAKREMGRMLRTSPFNYPIVFDPESPKAMYTNIDPDDLAEALADLRRRVLPNMALLTADLTTPKEATND
ncbi:hypothetical protein FHL15_002627 [Xylaria flabelliformis]|uniref:Cadherin domain-containing protein n=1 Tax=Xylaria flabelliformis TaxID=2512241 RepID=A0A553I827_9PEZI|nr:hypothetical protein FHL15_002627 [Xylaria flabelliformis]